MTFKKNQGFTLIEILLVMVIISIIIYASINYVQQRTEMARIDRTTLQMQQILNAGLAYYVSQGKWPTSLDTDLRNGYYLPPASVPFNNPWAQAYKIVSAPPTSPPSPPPSSPPNFYVYTTITAATDSTTGSATAAARAIAGSLPLAYTTANIPMPNAPPAPGADCTNTTTMCYVVASVNIPGQNLNNARAINFAGLYHHGGCIPVPQCPVDVTGTTMTPQVMVVPVSIAGVNDEDNINVYPITSFSAYATGNTPLDIFPPRCQDSDASHTQMNCALPGTNNGNVATAYWRACAKIITDRGDVQATRGDAWGNHVTLMAITRCAVNNEPSGSTFSVYSN